MQSSITAVNHSIVRITRFYRQAFLNLTTLVTFTYVSGPKFKIVLV